MGNDIESKQLSTHCNNTEKNTSSHYCFVQSNLRYLFLHIFLSHIILIMYEVAETFQQAKKLVLNSSKAEYVKQLLYMGKGDENWTCFTHFPQTLQSPT